MTQSWWSVDFTFLCNVVTLFTTIAMRAMAREEKVCFCCSVHRLAVSVYGFKPFKDIVCYRLQISSPEHFTRLKKISHSNSWHSAPQIMHTFFLCENSTRHMCCSHANINTEIDSWNKGKGICFTPWDQSFVFLQQNTVCNSTSDRMRGFFSSLSHLYWCMRNAGHQDVLQAVSANNPSNCTLNCVCNVTLVLSLVDFDTFVTRTVLHWFISFLFF